MLPRRPPLHYPDRPFHHFLQDAADRHPEEVGLLFGEDRYTYRDLDGIGNAFAHWLASRGVGKGDRVALVVTNRPEWVLALHGITTPQEACKALSLLAQRQFRMAAGFALP